MRTDIRGICRAFYNDEGWGWISVDGEDDVWVHLSAIPVQGFRALSPGQKVIFDLEEKLGLKEQSRRAVNVRFMSERQ